MKRNKGVRVNKPQTVTIAGRAGDPALPWLLPRFYQSIASSVNAAGQNINTSRVFRRSGLHACRWGHLSSSIDTSDVQGLRRHKFGRRGHHLSATPMKAVVNLGRVRRKTAVTVPLSTLRRPPAARNDADPLQASTNAITGLRPVPAAVQSYSDARRSQPARDSVPKSQPSLAR